MNENIEYKKGWQIKKNGSPTSLHNRFNDDKIYGVIDSTGNLGESFLKIYKDTVLKEQQLNGKFN